MNNREIKRQELARQLVSREIYLCLSMLVGDLANFENGEYYDEVLDASSVEDYEEALRPYIENADADELEALIEENGYWDDFVTEHIKLPTKVTADEGGDDDHWLVDGEIFYDKDDAWEKAIELALPELRDKVRDHVSSLSGDDQRDLCDSLRIDWHEYDREVYEHWAISDWLGRKLNEHGEKTVRLYGITVWCRTCTGQSISMDGVIQRIAWELWGDAQKDGTS